MQILSVTDFLAPRGKTTLQAINGQPPYTYSLQAGGAGGSVNASTGVYQAPSDVFTGTQTVIATDDNGDSESIKISILSYIQILAAIIKKQLNLASDQVYIYNQKIIVPKDERLYVAIKINTSTPFGNNRRFDSVTDEEVLTAQFQDNVSIDLKSRSLEALSARGRILNALNSSFSQNMQVINSFKLASIPTNFNDISEAEGSVIPYRFNISLNMLYSIQERSVVNYYENFPLQVETSTQVTKNIDLE